MIPRVSVLGLGVMGLRHARVLASLPECFELAGAYDVNQAVEVPSYVRRFDSEAEAIARADVVVVATPVEAHEEPALRAMAAGRHVLVEKPLCGRAELADELVSAALRSGVRVFVGHSERFNPVVRTLARLLREDPVQAMDLERMGPSRRVPQGVLLNLGVHDFDLACYLGGADLAVRCALGRGCGETSEEDVTHVLFEFPGGAVGHIHLDRTRPARRRSISVVTSHWRYEGDLLSPRLVRTSRPDGVASEVPLSIEEPLVAQALALSAALRGQPGRELAGGAEGARAVRLAELAAAQCRDASSDRSAENLSLRARF